MTVRIVGMGLSMDEAIVSERAGEKVGEGGKGLGISEEEKSEAGGSLLFFFLLLLRPRLFDLALSLACSLSLPLLSFTQKKGQGRAPFLRATR